MKDLFITDRKISPFIYVAIVVYFVAHLLTAANISQEYFSHTLRVIIDGIVLVLLIIHLIIRDIKNPKWLVADAAVFAGTIAITRIGSINSSLIFFAAFVIAVAGADMRKIAKLSFITIALTVALIVTLSYTGAIEPEVFIRSRNGLMYSITSFGFSGYASLSYAVFILNICYLIMRKDVKYWELPIMVFADYLIFCLIDNRLVFVIEILMLIMFALFKLGRNTFVRNRIFSIIMATLPCVMLVLSIYTAVAYDPTAGNKLNELDTALSGRLTYAHQALETLDITAFGQEVKMRGNLPFGETSTTAYFFIDNGYLAYLYLNGIVVLGILLFMSTFVIYKSSRDGNYTVLSIMLATVIGNFVSPLFMLVDFWLLNPILFFFVDLFLSAINKKRYVIGITEESYS